MEELNKLAPIKSKTIRGNNAPFMNKTLRKAIMHRSRLKKIYLKNRTEANELNFKRQQNHCVSLLRQTKKDYFSNLNENSIKDNKKFWRTIRPFFSEKSLSNEKIILIEKDKETVEEKILEDDKKIANIFSQFFANIVKNLNISKPPEDPMYTESSSGNTNIFESLVKYNNHPSIIKIRDISRNQNFQFKKVTEEEIKSILNNLPSDKSQSITDIPMKLIKENTDTFVPFLQNSGGRNCKNCALCDTSMKLGTVLDDDPKLKNLMRPQPKIALVPLKLMTSSKIKMKIFFIQNMTYYISIDSIFDNKQTFQYNHVLKNYL